MTTDDEAGSRRADDYEYDLAHEAGSGPPPEPHEPERHAAPDMHTDGDAGDYGHDMAHDMG
jgi:hypothetical protein